MYCDLPLEQHYVIKEKSLSSLFFITFNLFLCSESFFHHFLLPLSYLSVRNHIFTISLLFLSYLSVRNHIFIISLLPLSYLSFQNHIFLVSSLPEIRVVLLVVSGWMGRSLESRLRSTEPVCMPSIINQSNHYVRELPRVAIKGHIW